ncbi:MAG: TrbI/VirB10 family protein [Proteobacteria bacterium]|nr:TrbI/VirB10 family protein [Pseudomonadota bacterium]
MGDLSTEKFPIFDEDPRLDLSPEALEEASRNAFPVVAGDAKRRDKGGLMLGAAIAIALGVLTFTGLSRDIKEVKPPKPAQALPVAAPTAEASATPKIPAPAPAGVAPPTPAQSAVLAAPPTVPAQFQVTAVSPVMVYDTSAALDAAQPASVDPTGGKPGSAPIAGLNENEAFGSRLGGVGVETASATRLADPANTVTQGTLIPAILETAIDSDLPGYVRAVVSQDVRSFDGARVLVPRSSRLIGQYKSGLSAGQTRAYVIWTRLIRPDGVSVALASPAVEYSGRSGLSGTVDGHFFKRFGSASLLSVIGGLGALATGGAAGLLISSNSQSAAAVAAQRDAQIPPTVRVQPGQPVRVFTARDLSFSGVAQ